MPASVPEGWQRVRLGDIAEVVGGSTPPRADPDCWNGSIPWVTPTEVTRLTTRTVTETRECITEAGLKRAGLKLLPPGSVLLTTRATIGAVARVASPVTTNQGFQNLVPREGTDSSWLYYIAQHSRDSLQRLAGGSTFKEVSPQSIRGLELLLPPIEEQRAIAAVLDAVDDAIERTEAVIAATEELRRALLHELLTRGVPGMHSEWRDVPGLGSVPACWEVTTLGEVVDVKSGQADPRDPALQELLFVAPDDVEQATGRLLARRSVADANAISGKYEFDANDVIYSKIRPYLMKVYLPQERGLCSADMYPIRPRSGLTRGYLALVLLSPDFTEYARTCSDRTGIPKINRRELLRFKVALPPEREQDRIAQLEEALQQQWDMDAQRLAGAVQLKTALADALLTGRLRVRDRAYA